MKIHEFLEMKTDLPTFTQFKILEMLGERLNKNSMSLLNMDLWSVLAELCEKSYVDSHYNRLKKENSNLKTLMKEAIDILDDGERD